MSTQPKRVYVGGSEIRLFHDFAVDDEEERTATMNDERVNRVKDAVWEALAPNYRMLEVEAEDVARAAISVLDEPDELARLRAQITYLRDYAINKALQVYQLERGKTPDRDEIRYIIGGIDGNMGVAADRATAKEQG